MDGEPNDFEWKIFPAALDILRIVEKSVAVPGPQIQEEIIEAIPLIPAERISERIVEKSVPVPGPEIQEETVVVIQLSPLELTSVDEAPELKACTTRIMQLLQRKTRAQRQGKHKIVLKLEKEIATAMASKREVLRNRFEDIWREVARQMPQTWHRNAQGGAEDTLRAL